MRLLEQRIGATLFDRSKRPPRLTEVGRTVLDFGKQLVSTTGDLERYLQEFSSGISGEVRVGAISSISSYLLMAGFTLVNLREKLKQQIETWGDPFKYGLAANKDTIETFNRYNLEQGLVRSVVPLDRQFAASTLET